MDFTPCWFLNPVYWHRQLQEMNVAAMLTTQCFVCWTEKVLHSFSETESIKTSSPVSLMEAGRIQTQAWSLWPCSLNGTAAKSAMTFAQTGAASRFHPWSICRGRKWNSSCRIHAAFKVMSTDSDSDLCKIQVRDLLNACTLAFRSSRVVNYPFMILLWWWVTLLSASA